MDNNLVLGVKKVEDRAVIPQYQTSGSAGFDLHAIDSITIPANGTAKIRTGLAFDIPEGYELQIRPRSGMSANTKLRISNAPGTIDSDYKSEVLILIDNIDQNQANSVAITQGQRIAQAVLVKVNQAVFRQLDELSGSRGGFGSTGE